MSSTASLDLKSHLAGLFETALGVVAPEARATAVTVERPKQASHGDYASNVAMQVAKQVRRNPREVATALIAQLPA